MCLGNRAHVMALNHDIFKTPHAVTPTLVEEPHKQDPGRMVKNWTVFKEDPSIEIGLVSNRDKLANAADTEILSGGVNSKGDRGVALAREANMFQWGFTGPPSAMTEEARQVFVNSICYIAKFDGHSVWPKDAGRKIANIAVGEPTTDHPLTASAAILEPSAGKGDTVTLVVRVKIAKGWHIYADVPEGSLLPVTELTLKLPEGIKAKGDWKLPDSVVKDEFRFYEGDLVFSRKLVVGEGPIYLSTLDCTLHFQACDDELCLPPDERKWSLNLPIRR